MSIFKKVLSVGSGKLASELNDVVQAINDKEKEFELFSDEEIKVNFQDLSKKLNGDPQNIEVEAFAYIREAAKRTLGQRHYDVQIFGGLVLLRNKIAEMKTGEGKTLVSTLPAYLNSPNIKYIPNLGFSGSDSFTLGKINLISLAFNKILSGLEETPIIFILYLFAY